MDLRMFICVTAILMLSEGLIVKGPSGPLVVPLGASVLLPCSVDSLSSMEDLEVQWRRSDSETLVHLFQDGDVRPEVQQQEYHDRAHFFTENIKHGNFSLLLENVRAEDEGEYTCKVYSGHESAETVVKIKDVERLIVSGSNRSISVYVGEDVTLSCSVVSHIPPEEIEEVSWKKTDKDGDLLVLLYQNNETLSDSSHERYRDRVEFFTDEIHRGNFSLRLKSVRTEDKGVYMCLVFAGRLSANTTVILERLGFSALHIIVLILCITACGSALLICCLIYCGSNNTDSVLHLQMFLVFCPNISMFFAFVFWGVSEGSVNESVCCSALYILRPLMLLWAAPYANDFKGKMKTLILEYSYIAKNFVLTAVVYLALLTNTSQKLWNYAEFDRVLIIILYVIMFLCCFSKSVYILAAQIGNRKGRIIIIFEIVADLTFEILPTLQFILLFYTFGSARGGFIIIAVLPVFLTMANERMFFKCYRFGWSFAFISMMWLIVTLVLNVVMIVLYIFMLGNKTDPTGWACVMVFLQILWAVVRFSDESYYISIFLGFHRFISVYVFGSVGVVLISAVALMTELRLKTVNGERAVMDLRFIVFPSESFFIMSVLILGQLAAKIQQCLQPCQRRKKPKQTSADRSQQNQNQQCVAESDETPATESNQNQNSAESLEINPLLKTEAQEAGRTEETQPDSVISQT